MKNLPKARAGHRSPGRVRLKIDEERGNVEYFSELESELIKRFGSHDVTTTPLTGSILILGDSVDLDAVSRFGEHKSFFSIEEPGETNVPIAQGIVDPLLAVNAKIKDASDGAIDLPGLIFMSALLFGVVEIARGNFRSPPWYTAFWYAFGVYSKLYFDQKSADDKKPG